VIFPFELVIVGGDDVTIITSADRAIQAALDFCDGFTAQMQSFAQERGQPSLAVAMSAGVVFAHSSHPIALLDDLAGQLLKSAKARSRKLSPDSLTPTVDFMVVTAATVGDLKTVRADEYRQSGAGGQRLTQRPYTTTELRQLLGVLQWMKYPAEGVQAFPRNQLHDLYQIPFRSLMQAELDYLLLRSRLADSDKKFHRQMLRRLAEVGGMTERGIEGPWRSVAPEPGAPSRDTNLVDAVELYDFVPELPPFYSRPVAEDRK
jgi:CRISPR-associated protein Cmr2